MTEEFMTKELLEHNIQMQTIIEEVTTHLLNGLCTDGSHHKQYDLEQALIALRGEEWVEQNRWVNEEGDAVNPKTEEGEVYERWERGITP